MAVGHLTSTLAIRFRLMIVGEILKFCSFLLNAGLIRSALSHSFNERVITDLQMKVMNWIKVVWRDK